MEKYIVSVELERASNANSLQSIIQSVSKDFIQIQPNVWIILSNKTIIQIRDSFFQVITKQDRLFIGGLTSNYEGLFTSSDSDYLRQKIYRR
ncbi:hypothetical protein ENFAE_17950 [Enterococcus faecalis]|nr:hypothetical protein ENFAE_17950 [Enterococcus faecalis]